MLPRVLRPLDRFPVEHFLNNDVLHRRFGRRTMPLLLARRKPYDVARPNLFDRAAIALHQAVTEQHDQGLPERVRVPCATRTRLERHRGAGSARRWSRVEDERVTAEIRARFESASAMPGRGSKYSVRFVDYVGSGHATCSRSRFNAFTDGSTRDRESSARPLRRQ